MREVKDDSDYYQKEKLPFIEMGRTMGGVDFKGEKIRSLVWGILSLRYLLDFEVKMSQVAGRTDLETDPDWRYQLSISDAQMKSKVMR